MSPQDQQRLLTRLREYAKSRGVVVHEVVLGHYHLQGHLLVNYYPFSKNRTAYVAGTVAGHRMVTPEQAVAMALKLPKLPPGIPKPQRLTKNTRKLRTAMMSQGATRCHWCQVEFQSVDDSTLEHVIPLSRGGLDNPNNRVLACKPCNTGRGNHMPELKALDKPRLGG